MNNIPYDPNLDEDFYYSIIYIRPAIITNKNIDTVELIDIQVQEYNVITPRRNEFISSHVKYMTLCLFAEKTSIPSKIYSLGAGANFHKPPYWTGPEKNIINQIKKKIDLYGFENLKEITDIEALNNFSKENN